MEEVDERFGDHGPDALNRRQLRLAAFGERGAAQLLDRAEAFAQVARRHDPDMADAEAEQETRPVRLALGLDCREEIVDRLLLPALAAEQLGAVVAQAEDVCGGMQPA